MTAASRFTKLTASARSRRVITTSSFDCATMSRQSRPRFSPETAQVASGLRILITNNTLDRRAGTEVWTRDLAVGLLRRGHLPVAYSAVLGEIADEMRWATIPVVSDLSALGVRPDLIHGQHHLDAVSAMLRFPDVPAVYMCHGFVPWEEEPPAFPSIKRYIAVDDLCRERLLATPGITADRVRVVRNS